MDTPVSLAHRILKSLKDYTSYADCPAGIPDWARVCGNDRILGIYTNRSKVNNDRIIVTDQSLYWISDQQDTRVIRYADIQSVNFPPKEEALRFEQNHPQAGQGFGLTLITKTGSKVLVPILGGQGKLRDAYEFGRFVMRIVEHTRSQLNRGL